VERLAERLGVVCVTRTAGGGAKAGNIEFARQSVGATGDALVVIFDADMAAEPEFLLKTVPPLADPGVAWVQTGQYYRNMSNPIARWANDQQALFYSAICP
ncbi:MAG: glycosyltransferase, partial [Armatimonadota bacterium]